MVKHQKQHKLLHNKTIFTKLYKALPHFTNMSYTTIQNNYTTLQDYTQFYKTNYTKLYKTRHHFTTTYNTFYETLQIFAKRHITVRIFTNKKLQNCFCHKPIHNSTQLYTNLQNYTKLYKPYSTLQIYRKQTL